MGLRYFIERNEGTDIRRVLEVLHGAKGGTPGAQTPKRGEQPQRMAKAA